MRKGESLSHEAARKLCLAVGLAICLAAPSADANDGVSDGETAAKGLLENWYAELRRGKEARFWSMLAPGGRVAPDYRCSDDTKPRSRVADLDSPPYPHLLAVVAKKFAFEVQRMQMEPTLARVDVWERGWTYAGAAKVTYENAASATFVLQRKEGEDWKVLLYASDSRPVRDDHRDDPLPDLAPHGAD